MGFLDSLTGAEAGEKQARELERALNALRSGRFKTQKGYQDVLSQLYAALEAYQGQFPNVLGELDDIGAELSQTAFEEYQQRVGGGTQDLISSGMTNSTVLQSFKSGEQARYLRNLSAMKTDLAQLRSGVRLQGLGMEIGLRQALSGAYERRTGAVTDWQRDIAGTRMGVQYTGQNVLGGLFGNIGQSLGTAFGGPAGGAIGGAAGSTLGALFGGI